MPSTLPARAFLEVGVGLAGGRLLPPPLTEPPRRLAGLLRAQELVDLTRAEPGSSRDLSDQ